MKGSKYNKKRECRTAWAQTSQVFKKRIPGSAFQFALDKGYNATNLASKGQMAAFTSFGIVAAIFCFVRSANLTASAYFRGTAVKSSFINGAVLTAHAYFWGLTAIFA